jgi:2'-5' RNA ligase
MKEHYNCEVALRSPAHITLIPPFWMRSELEGELKSSINNFSTNESAIEIQLKDFSHFKPRVIFIGVLQNEALTSLRKRLENSLIATNRFPFSKEDRPFHPHVTIATRDLYKKAFYEAWEYFKDKIYEETWIANGISLLRNNKKNWDVIATSQFKSI